mmetsp:Transcript_3929/g.3719  ORF Transcript_3929/g.3719 Transcript_3929/m.3719 type:complete len:95 (-) Transcript_3929:591-875(-)
MDLSIRLPGRISGIVNIFLPVSVYTKELHINWKKLIINQFSTTAEGISPDIGIVKSEKYFIYLAILENWPVLPDAVGLLRIFKKLHTEKAIGKI